jgi:homoserine kinase
MANSVQVRVPATTANIGPGFDCLGAALTLYNEFCFTPALRPEIVVTGVGAATVSLSPDNMVYAAYERLCQMVDRVIPARLEIKMNVPLARGLGSSATAIVGGLVGANELAGRPLNQTQLADLATTIEGHPDNVVPALFGGCRLSASGIVRDWEVAELAWHPEIMPIVAIPDFELSTHAARSVLPSEYSCADAVFNAAHVGLLIQGLATGNPDWLRAALQDKIHQPYRQALIPGYAAVQAAAIVAGAHGLVISGAGPTLLALSARSSAEAVCAAMVRAWEAEGIKSDAMILGLDTQGTIVS